MFWTSNSFFSLGKTYLAWLYRSFGFWHILYLFSVWSAFCPTSENENVWRKRTSNILTDLKRWTKAITFQKTWNIPTKPSYYAWKYVFWLQNSNAASTKDEKGTGNEKKKKNRKMKTTKNIFIQRTKFYFIRYILDSFDFTIVAQWLVVVVVLLHSHATTIQEKSQVT